MPRLRPKRRGVRDFDEVEARADLQFERRWIPKGARLSRNDPAVVADVAGLHFQLPAIPLSEVLEREKEVNRDAD